MWGCAENNDTKQGKVNRFSKVKYKGKIKISQKIAKYTFDLRRLNQYTHNKLCKILKK